jgi:predicted GIY-YIG superfamily endonuclease
LYPTTFHHSLPSFLSLSLINFMPSSNANTIPLGRGFCCYILSSENWPTPYTGKTNHLVRRIHQHNHHSVRSRAYTKGKGPWRVAAVVVGLRSNRQAVWLERAIKRHAKHRTRQSGLNPVQTAILSAIRTASLPERWWRNLPNQPLPVLTIHVFATPLPKDLLIDAAKHPHHVQCHLRGF